MAAFEREYDTVFRLKVPFDQIYTSVFLLDRGKPILVDCATTAEDVDEWIVPALAAMGYRLSEIKAIVLTHSHDDHAGGLSRVRELAPEIEVVRDVCRLCDGISTYPLAGHTKDSIGVLDETYRTLLSGDGLQGAGVDRYRCSVKFQEDYIETLKRIQEDDRIERILFSHEYEPWYANRIDGRAEVLRCLAECPNYLKK